MSAQRRFPNIFPIFRERAPVLDKLKGLQAQQAQQKAGITPETLNEAQKRLMDEFRRGIADALGVPPEAIRPEPVERWIVEWTKAWVSPEFYAQAVVAMTASEAHRLGKGLGEMIATFIAEQPSGRSEEASEQT